jgi:hypothetical protein
MVGSKAAAFGAVDGRETEIGQVVDALFNNGPSNQKIQRLISFIYQYEQRSLLHSVGAVTYALNHQLIKYEDLSPPDDYKFLNTVLDLASKLGPEHQAARLGMFGALAEQPWLPRVLDMRELPDTPVIWDLIIGAAYPPEGRPVEQLVEAFAKQGIMRVRFPKGSDVQHVNFVIINEEKLFGSAVADGRPRNIKPWTAPQAWAYGGSDEVLEFFTTFTRTHQTLGIAYHVNPTQDTFVKAGVVYDAIKGIRDMATEREAEASLALDRAQKDFVAARCTVLGINNISGCWITYPLKPRDFSDAALPTVAPPPARATAAPVPAGSGG